MRHATALAIFSLLCILAPMAPAQDEEEREVELPGLELDMEKKAIKASGKFWIVSGELEFVAVGENGKLHESLLKLDCGGQDLQVALLLIGLEESSPDSWFSGSRVTLTAEWEHEGESHSSRVEELIWAAHRNATMHESSWVFTGSRFIEKMLEDEDGDLARREVFAPAVYQNYIAIYNAPLAMLDSSLKWTADDEVWFANEDALPPRGTPMTLTIQAVQDPEIPYVEEFPEAEPAPDEWPPPISAVDQEAREVRLAARFHRKEGLSNLLVSAAEQAVQTSPLLTIEGKPSVLRHALLEAGLTPSGELDLFGGDELEILVRWEVEKVGTVERPLHELLVARETGERLEKPNFTLVGSRMYRARRFIEAEQRWEYADAPACDLFGAVISLVGDANALIASGRKPRGEWWMIDSERVPEPGTPAEIVIRRVEQ